MKLTKAQNRAHNEGCALLKKSRISYEETRFIFDNWHEGAESNNAMASAYFTPSGLASDFSIDVPGNHAGSRVLDLCAGIGTLSYLAYHRNDYERDWAEFTCIEINPAYVEIGKKLFPEATWICADALDPDLLQSLGHFDAVISNSPFGRNAGKGRKSPRFTGPDFELKLIDVVSDIADYGTFIIPQSSSQFLYSGHQYYDRKQASDKAKRFFDQTKIEMECGVGIDCTVFKDDWKDVRPNVEIVTCDFREARESRAPQDLSKMTDMLVRHTEQLTLYQQLEFLTPSFSTKGFLLRVIL